MSPLEKKTIPVAETVMISPSLSWRLPVLSLTLKVGSSPVGDWGEGGKAGGTAGQITLAGPPGPPPAGYSTFGSDPAAFGGWVGVVAQPVAAAATTSAWKMRKKFRFFIRCLHFLPDFWLFARKGALSVTGC